MSEKIVVFVKCAYPKILVGSAVSQKYYMLQIVLTELQSQCFLFDIFLLLTTRPFSLLPFYHIAISLCAKFYSLSAILHNFIRP